MGISFSYGPPKDKQEMISLIGAAAELGIIFFDTAEVHGPFLNEELLGEAPAPSHGKVVIATNSALISTWIVPIPGNTKPNRLDENIGALSIELTPDDLRDINEAASTISVQGNRYPERLEAMTGR